MYKGTTPTLTLTLPTEIDLTGTQVYVTLGKSNGFPVITKTTEDLQIAKNVIEVFLTQEETLSLKDPTLLQVNWTYGNGQRSCSNIVEIDIKKNLINEVL